MCAKSQMTYIVYRVEPVEHYQLKFELEFNPVIIFMLEARVNNSSISSTSARKLELIFLDIDKSSNVMNSSQVRLDLICKLTLDSKNLYNNIFVICK